MLSFGGARAAFMLYQNARALSGAADHLSRYLVPLLREWSATDAPLARHLELLGARADSVCPALDFLLEWCSDKGSAVQAMLFHARDTMQRIERFMQSLGNGGTGAMGQGSSSKGGRASLTETEKATLMAQIDGHLRELDWAINSLNLAVSVINASTAARPVLPAGATYAAASSLGCVAPSMPPPEPPRYISPSCLLRASERMRSMAGGSGDVVVCYGSLFACGGIGGKRSFSDAVRAAQDGPAGAHAPLSARWTVPMGTVVDAYVPGGAVPPVDLMEEERRAASQPLAITLNSAGGRVLVSNEEDSSMARWMDGASITDARASSPQQDADEWADLGHVPSPACRNAHAMPVAIQQSLPLSPLPSPSSLPAAVPAPRPASVSPDFAAPRASGDSSWKQLFASASLKIVRNASRNVYELHVVDLSCSSLDRLTRPSASTIKFDLSASLAFRSSSLPLLGMPADIIAHLRSPTAPPIDAVFAFEERVANTLQTRYAFLLHGLDAGPSTPRGMGAGAGIAGPLSPALPERDRGDAGSPLDLAYVARLCMYENLHADSRGSGAQQGKRSANLSGHAAASLAHTHASDEELWLLLAGVHLQSPQAATQHAQQPPQATAQQPNTPTPTTDVSQPPAVASSSEDED